MIFPNPPPVPLLRVGRWPDAGVKEPPVGLGFPPPIPAPRPAPPTGPVPSPEPRRAMGLPVPVTLGRRPRGLLGAIEIPPFCDFLQYSIFS